MSDAPRAGAIFDSLAKCVADCRSAGPAAGHRQSTDGEVRQVKRSILELHEFQGKVSMNLGVDHPKAAIIAIDLHRGHLDMEVATMPTSPEIARQVIAANKRLFDWARGVKYRSFTC